MKNAEMIHFLTNYVQIKTMHPKPDYAAAIDLFKNQALKDGFSFQELSLPSGNPVLIISYTGTDQRLKALALNHHMDVVPAPNATDWQVLPFSGSIQNNIIIGRGVQDMKGIGVMHYFALKELKDRELRPKRTIHLLLVPDEELGGFKGTKELIETEAFKKLNIGFVIDEGRSSGNEEYLYIKTGERKPLQVSIVCQGSLAHGSNLMCTNVIHELVQLLHHIVLHHKNEQKKLTDHEAGILLSMNITSLRAGILNEGMVTINVVPDMAEATIDIRVPPHVSLEQVQCLLNEVVKKYPLAHYRVEARVDEMPNHKGEIKNLYSALEKIIKKHNLKVRQHISEGASDLRYYLAKNIEGVGFTPFTIEDNIHGTNESVPIVQLMRGKDIFFGFLNEFCC